MVAKSIEPVEALVYNYVLVNFFGSSIIHDQACCEALPVDPPAPTVLEESHMFLHMFWVSPRHRGSRGSVPAVSAGAKVIDNGRSRWPARWPELGINRAYHDSAEAALCGRLGRLADLSGAWPGMRREHAENRTVANREQRLSNAL